MQTCNHRQQAPEDARHPPTGAPDPAAAWPPACRLTQGQPKPPAPAAPPPATQGKGEGPPVSCMDSGEVPLLPLAPSAASPGAPTAPVPTSRRPVGEARAATPSSTGSAASPAPPAATAAAPHHMAVRRTFAPPAADEQSTQHHDHHQQQQQQHKAPPKAPGFLSRLFGRGANKGAQASHHHPAAPAPHHHANGGGASGGVADEVVPFDPRASLSASLPSAPGPAARQGAWAPGANGHHQPPTAQPPPPGHGPGHGHGHVEVSCLSASSSAFGDTLTGGAMAALMEGMYRWGRGAFRGWGRERANVMQKMCRWGRVGRRQGGLLV